MGTKTTPARQRAIGAIGGGKVRQLEEAWLEINEAGTMARLKELENRNKLLSDLTLGAADRNEVAALVLKEAVTSKV